MIRRIGRRGSLTLPKTLRAQTGLHPGMAVEIAAEDGKITIKAAHKCCHFCGSPEDVHSIDGINICYACVKRLAEVI